MDRIGLNEKPATLTGEKINSRKEKGKRDVLWREIFRWAKRMDRWIDGSLD